jgi:hypothetical protein
MFLGQSRSHIHGVLAQDCDLVQIFSKRSDYCCSLGFTEHVEGIAQGTGAIAKMTFDMAVLAEVKDLDIIHKSSFSYSSTSAELMISWLSPLATKREQLLLSPSKDTSKPLPWRA